jgi:2-polyprenyl-3-methyl-5-hydroxy-6-metoxy-1,4-benzoquinol methylase
MEDRTREEIQQEYNEIYRKNPNKWPSTEKVEFMYEMLDPYAPTPNNILDFGCGTGVALDWYHKKNPFANPYGIDISEEAIKLAQAKVPDARFTTKNEFEDIKTFDLIWCLGTAEHMYHLQDFLIDMKSRLTYDGLFYLEVPNCLDYSKGPEAFRRTKIGSHQVEWHLKRNTWERHILKAGFIIVKSIKGKKAPWEFIWILS